MKKIIISLLMVCAVLTMPVFANAQVLMGEAYFTQIAPMSEIEQLKTQLIALITQLIGELQAQLNALVAQQNAQQVQINNFTQPQAISAHEPLIILGCNDVQAKNFNVDATKDDGSCQNWPALTASCSADPLVIKPFERVNFNITATGGDGNYKYTTSFCDNNVCSTTRFISEGMYTENVQVKSNGQSVMTACQFEVKK